MCILIGKYFKGVGWVVAKNRDQDYTPTVYFPDEPGKFDDNVLVQYDEQTGYSEGMNKYGMGIITTSSTESLMAETDDKDGLTIHKALKCKTPQEAADYLVNHKLDGYVAVFNKDTMIFIESDKNDRGEYHHVMKEIPLTETIVRTNHGVWLKTSGYQPGIDPVQTRNWKSSVCRLKLAEKIAKEANDPMDLIDGLASKNNDNLQMNNFRVQTKPREMRTVSQIMVVPSKKTIYVRPVDCRIILDPAKENIKVNVLSNKILLKTYPSLKAKPIKTIDKKDGSVIITTECKKIKNFISFI